MYLDFVYFLSSSLFIVVTSTFLGLTLLYHRKRSKMVYHLDKLTVTVLVYVSTYVRKEGYYYRPG